MKRMLLLDDEELDRIIAWFDHAEVEMDVDEDDEAVAEKLKAARLR